jgi:glycosyltransferase involved in cell wall biosynthesis
MNILFVTPRWTRDGGVAAHVMSSAAALAERGITVDVTAARVESATETAGVTVHRAPDLFNTRLPPDLRLGETPAGDASVVHLHQFDDPAVVDFIQVKKPLVVSAHGYTACTSGVHYFKPGQECTRAHGPGCIPNLLLRGCAHTRHLRSLPPSYRRASDGLSALRRAEVAVSYSSVIDRHLAVNGVARRSVVPFFPTTVSSSETEHVDHRRVVFAGRVIPAKGVAVLVRAAREVDAEFVVCGEGWQLASMRKLARRLGVDGRIDFRGWLNPEQLGEEFAQASIVALPSLWPEPFGLVGIEAFAAGRPVVASATGGVEDWLDHGVSGLRVRPGDAAALARALNELLDDPERRRQMGAAGREMVTERFTADRHVAALLDVYDTARARWQRERGQGDGERLTAASTSAQPSKV